MKGHTGGGSTKLKKKGQKKTVLKKGSEPKGLWGQMGGPNNGRFVLAR